MDLVVIDKQQNKFLFLRKTKYYQEYEYNSNQSYDNSKSVRRYIYDKIKDLSRNKRKYNLYIIICDSDIYNGIFNNYTKDGLLTDNANIFLSFRNFNNTKYLVM